MLLNPLSLIIYLVNVFGIPCMHQFGPTEQMALLPGTCMKQMLPSATSRGLFDEN
jgi:hypothetical protein